jgi:hypothetical protein
MVKDRLGAMMITYPFDGGMQVNDCGGSHDANSATTVPVCELS